MQNAFYFSSFSRLKFVHKNTSLTQQGGVWQKKCKNVIICATKVTLAKSQFISMNCDELTTVDNQSWLFVHAYVTDDWKQLPLLLNMYKVVDETIADNMTSLIVKSLGQHGGLSETNIASKLVCFRANGVTICHGVKSGVVIQLMQKHAPYLSNVHCMAHHTNPVVKTLNGLNLVFKIETLFTSMHNYFIHKSQMTFSSYQVC